MQDTYKCSATKQLRVWEAVAGWVSCKNDSFKLLFLFEMVANRNGRTFVGFLPARGKYTYQKMKSRKGLQKSCTFWISVNSSVGVYGKVDFDSQNSIRKSYMLARNEPKNEMLQLTIGFAGISLEEHWRKIASGIDFLKLFHLTVKLQTERHIFSKEWNAQFNIS